ncbi:cytosine permease [Veronia nyctiphanis]|uniref:cytosine permease n=1 Tax=Veronia nyctiphanis TaxID=1278244 RepID=UPI00191C4AD8|nr:cytosine permease [Veronia nyctiphanis]
MKLRLINPNTSTSMTKKMGQTAQSVASEGTKILYRSPETGPESIESHFDEALSVIGVLDEIRKGEQEGTDSYIVAGFGDPGVCCARSRARPCHWYCLVINGEAGYKYGIPFMVQARSAFGFVGTKLPGIVRAVPAIVWYGFQSWVGARALNAVSATLFGYDNMVIYFILFQFIQIGLSIFGFQGIKWLENIGSGFILISLVYMFISIINKYCDEITTNLVNIEGTWGVEFWSAAMLFLGIYSTMMLNVSDYSRELKKGTEKGLLTTISPCRFYLVRFSWA